MFVEPLWINKDDWLLLLFLARAFFFCSVSGERSTERNMWLLFMAIKLSKFHADRTSYNVISNQSTIGEKWQIRKWLECSMHSIPSENELSKNKKLYHNSWMSRNNSIGIRRKWFGQIAYINCDGKFPWIQSILFDTAHGVEFNENQAIQKCSRYFEEFYKSRTRFATLESVERFRSILGNEKCFLVKYSSVERVWIHVISARFSMTRVSRIAFNCFHSSHFRSLDVSSSLYPSTVKINHTIAQWIVDRYYLY